MKIKHETESTASLSRPGKIKNSPAKLALILPLAAGLVSCVGYVDGGGGVVVGGPDVTVFGGDYYHGHDVHAWSHRGAESRHDAHFGGRRR